MWALPWTCLHEFLAIVTHPKIFSPPTPLADAREAVRAWADAPTLRLLVETSGYRDTLDRLLQTSGVVGPKIHNARVAALCLHHAVEVLWTADRDFSRFPELKTRNPLIS